MSKIILKYKGLEIEQSDERFKELKTKKDILEYLNGEFWHNIVKGRYGQGTVKLTKKEIKILTDYTNSLEEMFNG